MLLKDAFIFQLNSRYAAGVLFMTSQASKGQAAVVVLLSSPHIRSAARDRSKLSRHRMHGAVEAKRIIQPHR